MKKFVVFLFFISFSVNFLYADAEYQMFDNSSIVAAKYLDFGSSAAAAGMGNAYIGVVNDAASIYWNPAGLCEMQKQDKDWHIYFAHNIWFQDIMASDIALAKNFKKIGVFALGISYLNFGSIQRTDIDSLGNPIFRKDEKYSPYSIIIHTAYAGKLEDDLDAGINLKYILDNIDGNVSQTLAFDLGLRYAFPYLKGLSFNLVSKNFGGRLNEFILSKEISFAVSYIFSISNFSITLDYDIIGKVANNPLHRFGIEIETPYIFVFRTGYHTDNTTIKEGFKNFTFGIGIKLSDKYADFAYEPYGDIGNVYKISFGGNF
ncbi:MAG: PorV/PorQ family protein [Candidatus Goldbacteria bacterium]|nr:PorV/PorQ family protein [Candidatus Goldiibacteriota bacterium]